MFTLQQAHYKSADDDDTHQQFLVR